jgi:hypothetical protein
VEEIAWYVGCRIGRDTHGNIHWFIESSDGLSGGHLVDEGSPTTLMAAVLAVRREAFAELIRLVNGVPQQFPGFEVPSKSPGQGGAPRGSGVPPVHSPRGTDGIW